MAYTKLYREQPKPQKAKEASPVEVGFTLAKNVTGGLEKVNKVQERRLENSGWLDEYIEGSDGEPFKVFKRLPGKGAFRGPEDRIQLTDKAKEHFVNLAEKANFDADGNIIGRTLPEEFMTEYIDNLGEGSEALKDISNLKNMDKSLKDRDEWLESLDASKEYQSDLMNEANLRGKEFVDKVSSGGFGKYGKELIAEDKETGIGFDGKLPDRLSANLGINPDLISGKKAGFSGVKPDIVYEGSEHVGLNPELGSDMASNIIEKAKKTGYLQRQQNFRNAVNLREKFSSSPEMKVMKALPQIGQGGMKTIGQEALKSMLPGLGNAAGTAAAGTAAGAGTTAALATNPVGWTIMAASLLDKIF